MALKFQVKNDKTIYTAMAFTTEKGKVFITFHDGKELKEVPENEVTKISPADPRLHNREKPEPKKKTTKKD